MNFKTTIVLLVLLVVAGGYLLWSSGEGEKKETAATEAQGRLLGIEATDVTKLTITPASGQRVVLEKSGADWRLAEPVAGAAERWTVEELVQGLTALKSRGQLDVQGKDATAAGLEQPRYRVELVGKDGKSAKLAIGSKSPVGDSMYVLVDGRSKADVVPADLSEKLEQPVSALRQARLIDTPMTEIKQITITRADGKLVLQKAGNDWQMVEPQKMPVDSSEATDLLGAITGLRAAEFVSEDARQAGSYGLAEPKMSVWFSTAAATTQPAQPATQEARASGPAAKQEAGVTIKFGRYEDVLKKNVFATVSNAPSIVKVASTVLTTLNKKPLELRDKKVLQVEADRVSRIAVSTDLAATTQPTTRPAVHQQIVVERRKETLALGPSVPATGPVTQPTTQAEKTPHPTLSPERIHPSPSPLPGVPGRGEGEGEKAAATQPASKWVLSGSVTGAADDAAVEAILRDLQPLRAVKYLEKSPATRPAGRYVVAIHSEGPGGTPVNDYEITLSDPGNGEPLVGLCGGLVFEVERTVLEHLQADLTHKAEVAQ